MKELSRNLQSFFSQFKYLLWCINALFYKHQVSLVQLQICLECFDFESQTMAKTCLCVNNFLLPILY